MGEARQPDARAAEWLAANVSGASFAEIARQVGLTPERIRQVVRTHPDYVCAPRPYAPQRDPEFIEAVRRLRDQGLSTAEVGRHLGVTKNVVVGICTRHLKMNALPHCKRAIAEA
jgi:hypothetical protein